MTKRDRVRQMLRDARSQGQGWIDGEALRVGGGGSRYGARLHELTKEGFEYECDTSRRDRFGDVKPRYRLTFDPAVDTPEVVFDGDQALLFGEAA